MLAARKRAMVLPAVGVLMLASTDMEASGIIPELAGARSHSSAVDDFGIGRGYLGAANAEDPLASPMHGNLRGLPPMLLQCGDRETLLDDTLRSRKKARAAGVRVEVEIFEDMIHVFQMFATELDEARRAIASAGEFIPSLCVAPAGGPTVQMIGSHEPVLHRTSKRKHLKDEPVPNHSCLDGLRRRLSLPLIAAPMFLVSGVKLVVAACLEGVIGAFPTANCRSADELDHWLRDIAAGITAGESRTGRSAAPACVNLIVHKSNSRLADDLPIHCRHKPRLVITTTAGWKDLSRPPRSMAATYSSPGR